MSVIGYREWQFWVNLDLIDSGQPLDGLFEIVITPALMAEQTVGFLYEKIEEVRSGLLTIQNSQLKKYFDPWISPTAELVIRKYDRINSEQGQIQESVRNILKELDALSLCVDFPLTTNEIRFIVPPIQPVNGLAFVANRKPLGRGLAFEIEERGIATSKLNDDFDKCMNATESVTIASKHYLAGLALLGLEDSFAGLIDAAYMQFYQACEILASDYKLEEAKKYLAKTYPKQARELQIISHHVWQVRHNYFGHGNVTNSLVASNALGSTFNIAKQVLIARWLCRTLIDLSLSSKTQLAREMRLYYKDSSEAFFGSTAELEGSFRVNYNHRTVKIYDVQGERIDSHTIK